MLSSRLSSITRLLIHIPLATSIVTSKILTATIDDTDGDERTGIKPSYFPSTGVWNNNTCNNPTDCWITTFDPGLAFQGTWTAAIYRLNRGNKVSVSFRFQGTGISVFLIVANDVLGRGLGPTTLTECNFTLDGQLKNQYRHVPTPEPGLRYREEAFSISGLPNISHLLEISAENLDHEVYLNFDYAMYTYEVADSEPSPTISPSPSQDKKRPTRSIIGGAAGGVAALFVGGGALVAVLLYRRKRRRPGSITTFPTETGQSYTAPGFQSPSNSYSVSPTPNTSPTAQTQIRNAEQGVVGAERYGHARSMTELTSTGTQSSVVPSGSSVSGLREDIRRMREELNSLRQQNVPPPTYSTVSD
ncbi:hypothetical protein VNI00_012879 [Paramarasmius palmivorus]|uniref:Uncharacterized protein n=1 Tax=Paramarasmius palmivorus TaxID=297713 RepID=A0AAW0C004_9AGAR